MNESELQADTNAPIVDVELGWNRRKKQWQLPYDSELNVEGIFGDDSDQEPPQPLEEQSNNDWQTEEDEQPRKIPEIELLGNNNQRMFILDQPLTNQSLPEQQSHELMIEENNDDAEIPSQEQRH